METTNARCSVIYRTISVAAAADETRREAIDRAVRAGGGTATWRIHPLAGRAYALLELPDDFDATRISEAPEETVYESPIIAWALYPTVAEALPYLEEALGGVGRPVGVLACRRCPAGVVVEWDPSRCGIGLLSKLIDVELRRFGSGRRAELLAPLPPAVLLQIAAQGLQTPQIASDRVLELLIER